MTLNTKPALTTHVIDATDRTLGRVASEAAHALLGKRSVHFAKNKALPMKVVIENAGRLNLPKRRTEGKVYTRYTGYPGGLREMTMTDMIAKKGISAVVKKTVDGMIPRNKLRAPRMKNLVITE
ncbi:50S ribosomal protein L13 [Candidatus Kaiserbacteria bacterium RIFCSPLOWO2_02_FULL_54_13]|uniref:50S ribosomal protein L13 n=1 Tax=Candidatus Kaiserbacteria bacterium RIFCSPHIGHO2_02_FULL_54_22 TaxID=1798495 RepID=A0A1F6DNU1_9BACT|nr:MAG: 50S ribosomal protein L13 [Parcubacteria group bacterium GW2011_GWA1_54_9]OGG62960.1 MAG: 50S ribosomal protein L13 [Candidatus Kaiserbacteria bacterium RIFCSPHIGHO2_02_FULL_54_22]OGG67988.1 MAG: 50S ribosomal protein L13 [Candidatus Kaiserbacteria bacterium RIFCSPHIGHO2_12_FULL_54_16]OGG83587.1 MAG: 50S ribosomal protein L13 [Candidatus Kaiserbacteria bacterium RIFCSPLOWO2_02_FULL_54_13]